jgi:hypothetical protein
MGVGRPRQPTELPKNDSFGLVQIGEAPT